MRSFLPNSRHVKSFGLSVKEVQSKDKSSQVMSQVDSSQVPAILPAVSDLSIRELIN